MNRSILLFLISLGAAMPAAAQGAAPLGAMEQRAREASLETYSINDRARQRGEGIIRRIEFKAKVQTEVSHYYGESFVKRMHRRSTRNNIPNRSVFEKKK